MKDSYYFPHDYNAKGDQKILMLRAKYDNIWGYGLFFMILESMAEEEDGHIDREAIGGLSISYGLPIDKLTEFIDYCINIGLFFECKDGIYSRRMSDHKKTRKSLSDAGKQGAQRRWKNREAIATPLTTPMQRKGKERKGEEKKEKIVDDLDPLSQAIQNFKDMRVQIKSKMTDHAVDLLIKELEKLAPGDDEKKIAILNKSIVNSWKGVFPLKEGDYKSKEDDDRNNYKKLLIENRIQETQGNHDETRQKRLHGVAKDMIEKYTKDKVVEYRKQVLSSL